MDFEAILEIGETVINAVISIADLFDEEWNVRKMIGGDRMFDKFYAVEPYRTVDTFSLL